jgi:hypothetical protein
MPCNRFIQIRWQEGDIRDGVNGAMESDVAEVLMEALTARVKDKRTNSRQYALARNEVEVAYLRLTNMNRTGGNDGTANQDSA